MEALGSGRMLDSNELAILKAKAHDSLIEAVDGGRMLHADVLALLKSTRAEEMMRTVAPGPEEPDEPAAYSDESPPSDAPAVQHSAAVRVQSRVRGRQARAQSHTSTSSTPVRSRMQNEGASTSEAATTAMGLVPTEMGMLPVAADEPASLHVARIGRHGPHPAHHHLDHPLDASHRAVDQSSALQLTIHDLQSNEALMALEMEWAQHLMGLSQKLIASSPSASPSSTSRAHTPRDDDGANDTSSRHANATRHANTRTAREAQAVTIWSDADSAAASCAATAKTAVSHRPPPPPPPRWSSDMRAPPLLPPRCNETASCSHEYTPDSASVYARFAPSADERLGFYPVKTEDEVPSASTQHPAPPPHAERDPSAPPPADVYPAAHKTIYSGAVKLRTGRTPEELRLARENKMLWAANRQMRKLADDAKLSEERVLAAAAVELAKLQLLAGVSFEQLTALKGEAAATNHHASIRAAPPPPKHRPPPEAARPCGASRSTRVGLTHRAPPALSSSLRRGASPRMTTPPELPSTDHATSADHAAAETKMITRAELAAFIARNPGRDRRVAKEDRIWLLKEQSKKYPTNLRPSLDRAKIGNRPRWFVEVPKRVRTRADMD